MESKSRSGDFPPSGSNGGNFMVFEKLRDIIVDHLQLKREDIKSECRVVEDLNADSLDIVEMIMDLEDEFGVSIPDEAVAELKTVGDISSFVEKEIAKKK